ncbi:MAG: NupC/NupG family nucleoside CNT transporter [Planctomycetota bacterium]|jgi:CNT family concentrative nucleoside transporter
MLIARGLLGIAGLMAIAWSLSLNRRRFPFKLVAGGLLLQWLLAWIVLRTEPGRKIFDAIATFVTLILHGADQGAEMVFGPLAGSHPSVAWPAIVGIKIMTTIIVVATLSAIGYHYGILQRIVKMLAWVMTRSMGVSGAESFSGAANVFFGQTEAPLMVRPYISSMTQSELMALMTGGFATVATGVMAVYIGILAGEDSALAIATARHLLTACLMSAPAAFVMAKIMVPETGVPVTSGTAEMAVKRETKSLVDAMTTGAGKGMELSINVLAMLIAFIALIALLDALLIALGKWSVVTPAVNALGLEQLDLKGILGIVFWPVAWLIGVEQADCGSFGGLLGMAMATNELIAYETLGELIQSGKLSERTIIMATYSLCGFANLSSIGIQIGGIGGMAPDRRDDLIRLGPRAMLGGALACWSTGCIAGVLV